MSLPPARRWLAALLLLTVLAPEALPAGMGAHRCACGMVVGCCCLRKAAMKTGDHCALKRQAPSCALRPGNQVAAVPPLKDLAAWLGLALSDGLRPPTSVPANLVALDESPPDIPRPAPLVPPPRPIPVV
jgi:hypothetical protein